MKTIEIWDERKWDELPKSFDELTQIDIYHVHLIIHSTPGNSIVRLRNTSYAEVYRKARVRLYDHSSAMLHEESHAELYDCSHCILCDHARITDYRNFENNKILAKKIQKLKDLMLLTDPVTSNNTAGPLQMIQWEEYLRTFKDEQ